MEESGALAGANPRRWVALGVLASAQFLVTLDSSIVNVALPQMQADLGFTESGLAWVVNAYVLAFGGFLLLFGRLADLLGRREVFVGGAVLFTAGSMLAGITASAEVLLFARALQGLGAAALSPAALAIVLNAFPTHERAKALGIWGAVAAGGGSAGVLLGGFITSTLGWQWVFFVTVPVSAAAAIASLGVLPRVPGTGLTKSFDILGALTATGAVTAAAFAVLSAGERGWEAPLTWGSLVAAAGLGIIFILAERRAPAPLVPLRIFASREFSGGSAVTLLAGAAIMSMWFLLTLYLQRVRHYDAQETGLAYLPMTATILLISVFVVARVVARVGVRTVLLTGLTLLTLALGFLALLPADAAYPVQILPALLIGAAGVGFTYMPATMVAVGGVPASEAGLASGVVSMAFQVGGALGIAALSSISVATTVVAAQSGADEGLATGLSTALAVASSVSFIGLLAAGLLLRRKTVRVVEATVGTGRVKEPAS